MANVPAAIKRSIRKAYEHYMLANAHNKVVRDFMDNLGGGVVDGAILDAYIDIVELGAGDPEKVIKMLEDWEP